MVLNAHHNYDFFFWLQAEEMARGDVLSSWEKRSAHIPVIVDPAKIPKQIQTHCEVDKENKAVEDDINRLNEVGYRSIVF